MALNVTDIQVRNKEGRLLDRLVVSPRGSRYYEIADYTKVQVFTNEGIFTYQILPGFITNFRSGGAGVDCFIDQIGDSVAVQACWLTHDLNYTPNKYLDGKHPVGRKKADQLLRACLRFAGMGAAKSNAVYFSVRAFGGCAYHEDDHLTITNSALYRFGE